MSWSAPRTWAANEVVTAALLNTHLRDQLLETVPAKASAAGQVPYANGVNSIAMLSAVARRMPRFNAAGNALETVANLSLAQAPLYAVSASATNLSALPTLTDVATQAITTSGGLVVLIVAFEVTENKSAAQFFQHYRRLRRDTTDLLPERKYSDTPPFSVANPLTTNGSGLYLDNPAAGTYTYRLALSYANLATSGTPTGFGWMLIAELAG